MASKQSNGGVNPSRYDNIPTYVEGHDGELVSAVIETPAGTRHKYAFEAKYGLMRLRMTLAEGLTWPYDYGFIPQTKADDGDPLDVLVLNDAPTFSGCLIDTRVIGIFRLSKNGIENDRIVACPPQRPGVSLKTDAFKDIGDLPKDLVEGLKRFLVEYSEEEGNTIELKGLDGRKRAFKAIEESRKGYRNSSG